MEKIHTSQNPIDMLTKVVTRETEFLFSFSWSSGMIVKMRNFPSLESEDSSEGVVVVELL